MGKHSARKCEERNMWMRKEGGREGGRNGGREGRMEGRNLGEKINIWQSKGAKM